MIAIAAIRYFTRDYLLSFRYFAPLTVYLFAVAFVYGVVPNPIMPSFSFTSTVLFMVSAWLALGYIDLEPESQQIITSLRLRGMAAYYGLKIVPLAVLAIVLSVLTVVYPTFGGKFVRTPNAEELWTAMACHVGLAEMGCAAGILFTRKWFPKWYTAWGGLVLFIVVSLAGSRIIDSVPPAIGILEWVLPPLFRTMEMLNEYESATASERFLGMAMPCVYALALMILYIIGMSRKKM
jgi:hypothetical protein